LGLVFGLIVSFCFLFGVLVFFCFVVFSFSFDLGWCLASLWFGFVSILGDYVCCGLDWFHFLPSFGFYFSLFSYFPF